MITSQPGPLRYVILPTGSSSSLTRSSTLHYFFLHAVSFLQQMTIAHDHNKKAFFSWLTVAKRFCSRFVFLLLYSPRFVAPIILPCVGSGSCMIDLVHFVSWWCKRRPEAGFSFVRFSFVYVCSFHQLLFRFLCCHLVVVTFGFTSTSQVIG